MSEGQPFELEVRPPRAAGALRARYRATLVNRTDRILRIEVDAIDPQRQMIFSFSPKLVRLAPGERSTCVVTVKPERRSWLGVRVQLPFSVVAREMLNVGALHSEETTETISSDAIFEQREVLSKGTLAVGLLGIAAVGVFAYGPIKGALKNDSTTTKTTPTATTVPIGSTTTTLKLGNTTIIVTTRDDSKKAELNSIKDRIDLELAKIGLGYPTHIVPSPGARNALVVEQVPDAATVNRVCTLIRDKIAQVTGSDCQADPGQATTTPSSAAGSR